MNTHIGLHKFEDVNGNSSMIVKWLNAHRTVWRVLYVFPREEHLKLLFWQHILNWMELIKCKDAIVKNIREWYVEIRTMKLQQEWDDQTASVMKLFYGKASHNKWCIWIEET